MRCATRVQAADVKTAGQAMIHLLFRASLDGRIVRGPVSGTEHRYALVADWLPGAAAAAARIADERGRWLAELARRYLAGHAPADARDLARWAGLPLRDARAGLAAIARELRRAARRPSRAQRAAAARPAARAAAAGRV